MRIVATGLLSIAMLGAAISPGWCPEPADLDAPYSSTIGRDGADHGPAQSPKRMSRDKFRDEHQLKVYSSAPKKFNLPGDPKTRLTSPSPTSSAVERLGGGPSAGPSIGGKGIVSSSAATTKSLYKPVHSLGVKPSVPAQPQALYKPVNSLGVKPSVPSTPR